MTPAGGSGRPIKVLHLPTDSGIGGTERRIADFIRHSNQEHFEHVLMPLKPLGEIGAQLLDEGFEVKALGLTRTNAPLALGRVIGAIHESEADIVQTYLYGGNVLGRPAARAAGVAAVVSGYASTDPWMGPLDALADMTTARLATAHLANSDAVADAVVRRCHLPRTAITVVHTGRTMPEKVAPLTDREDGTLLGIAVGRIHKAKGYDVAIRALAKSDPRVRLRIAGGGEGRAALEAEAARAGVGDRVEFLGPRDDIEALLVESDFYLLPSRWEGMPGAMIEAMAAGLPVVATAVGGVPEAVAEGRCGFLAEPEDAESLAAAIDRIAADDVRRRQMGAEARIRAEEHFSISRMVSDWENFYRRIARESHLPNLEL